MPSPIGHALAGFATGWLAESIPAQKHSRNNLSGLSLPVACGLLATLPDLDILFQAHRSVSHSLGATVLVAGVVAVAARWRSLPVIRTTSICSVAYASHMLLDWLGRDTSSPMGVPLLWPLTNAYYVSGFDLFLEISRRYWRFDEFVLDNLRSVLREVAILGPVAGLAWWSRSLAKRQRQ